MKKFINKMKDPEQRTLFYAIFGGKMLGLGLCFLVIFCVSLYLGSASKAHAQTAPAAATAPATPAAAPAAPAPAAAPAAPAAAPADTTPAYVNPINTMWSWSRPSSCFSCKQDSCFLRPVSPAPGKR